MTEEFRAALLEQYKDWTIEGLIDVLAITKVEPAEHCGCCDVTDTFLVTVELNVTL